MAPESGGNIGELPIFELPLAIVPGELVPLHIFEERYKRMIGFCLDEDEPLGILLRDEAGGARRIGCSARVTQVLERFPDGRLDVVVTGEAPFVVLERHESSEYPAGEVKPLRDDEEAGSDGEAAAESARGAFSALVERVSGEPPDPSDFEDKSSYALAARVELPPETKQRLLELRSESERMQILAKALGALVEALAKSKQIAERAKLNGKVVVG
ncbi:MAG: LON peptidase substrate-binding domain-containing protein [Solirubrobacterales bacterium]|nr:LON peptidase substrate-binding domain-containing protein [Solirubrobacterales bacterium]